MLWYVSYDMWDVVMYVLNGWNIVMYGMMCKVLWCMMMYVLLWDIVMNVLVLRFVIYVRMWVLCWEVLLVWYDMCPMFWDFWCVNCHMQTIWMYGLICEILRCLWWPVCDDMRNLMMYIFRLDLIYCYVCFDMTVLVCEILWTILCHVRCDKYWYVI